MALTGGVGCGKSTVAAIFRDLGCEVWDADECVHTLEAPGGEACPAIEKSFGPRAITAAGGVDRAFLAELVFQFSPARKKLNDIVHPLVKRSLDAWLSRPERPGAPGLRLAALPLLFEKGWHRLWPWDALVCVSCDASEQFERISRQRGWTRDVTRKRIAAQWPVGKKEEMADYVIDNNSDIENLHMAVRQVLRSITEKKT